MGDKLDEGWVCTNDGFRIVGQFCYKGIIPASVFGLLQVFGFQISKLLQNTLSLGKGVLLQMGRGIWISKVSYPCVSLGYKIISSKK